MAMSSLHTAAGIRIGTLVPGPLGVLLSFLSHFLLDFFPEWCDTAYKNSRTEKVIMYAVEVVLNVYLLVVLWGMESWWIVANVVAAHLPDIIDFIYGKIRPGHAVFPFHPGKKLIDLGYEWQVYCMRGIPTAGLDLILVLLLCPPSL